MNFGFEPGTSFTNTSVPFWRISYFDPDLASQRPFGMFFGIGACVINRARGKRKNFIVAIILQGFVGAKQKLTAVADNVLIYPDSRIGPKITPNRRRSPNPSRRK